MDSSFLTINDMSLSWLTAVNLGLGFYCLLMLVKMIIQFGRPNHPARLTAYFVTLCATTFFVSKALVAMGFISPWMWLKYRPLPMVAGSLALLLQVIICGANFSLIQQKVVSRLPLIGGLLVLAFFPTKAEIFVGAAIFAACVLFFFSDKARYQKRAFFKMTLFILLFSGLRWINIYWVLIIGEVMLYFALFYFFIFEQTFGVASIVDEHQNRK